MVPMLCIVHERKQKEKKILLKRKVRRWVEWVSIMRKLKEEG